MILIKKEEWLGAVRQLHRPFAAILLTGSEKSSFNACDSIVSKMRAPDINGWQSVAQPGRVQFLFDVSPLVDAPPKLAVLKAT